MRKLRIRLTLSFLFIATLILGCAAEVVRTPEQLTVNNQAAQIELTKLVTIELSPGNEKKLFTGSRWMNIGNVKQGEVFKPVGTVFSIQGANSHEAYLVIAEQKLVGFYLPGDRAWTAIKAPIAIEFKKVQ
jgi:UPF0288 family protein (methanogenesis marker protein 3)